MLRPSSISILLLGLLPQLTAAAQILKTSGFSTCLADSTITVQNVDIEYNNDNKTVTFNVAGTSTKVQNVTAQLNVYVHLLARTNLLKTITLAASSWKLSRDYC
jgi:hypothetical protein